MEKRLEAAYEEIKAALKKHGVVFHVGINKELMLVPDNGLRVISDEDTWIEFDNVVIS